MNQKINNLSQLSIIKIFPSVRAIWPCSTTFGFCDMGVNRNPPATTGKKPHQTSLSLYWDQKAQNE